MVARPGKLPHRPHSIVHGAVLTYLACFLDARFIRYLAAGGISFIVDYALLLGLTEWLGWHYLLSATVGFTVGALVCYGLSVLWVFDERRYQNRTAEAALFFLIGGLGLGLNDALLWALADGIGWPYQLSKLIVAGVVLAFNYSARLFFLFSTRAVPPRS